MSRTHIFLIIKLTFSLLIFSKAHGFPDTLRHGYTNCSTCHLSPSGGGLLTQYGRSLSREALSTWGSESEELPLHGLIQIPDSVMEHFFIGGDARYISVQKENSTGKTSDGFWMQAQMRFAVAYEKIKFIFSTGKIKNPRESQAIKWEGTEYYLLWNPRDEVYFRAGRFEPIYGIRLPDHNLWIKSELGFSPWIERDCSEIIFEGERQFLSLTGFQSTSAMAVSDQKTGYIAHFSQIIGERSRLGVSALNSEGQGVRTKSFTAHGTISFSSWSYSLWELTRLWNLESVKDIGFVRFGYEAYKGFTQIIQGQTKSEKNNSKLDQSKLGVGVIWLPRPHFEIMALSEKLNTTSSKTDETTIMLHYYF